MTTSSSTDFEPNVAEFIEEAFERCGLELRTGYDLKTAKRSINIMLAEWANQRFKSMDNSSSNSNCYSRNNRLYFKF
jgi:hypothetical protein